MSLIDRIKSEKNRLVGQIRAGAAAFRVASQAYEAATQGRRAVGWIASSSGPNSSLTNNLSTLRNRSRAAYRNNPLIQLGVKRNVSNEIGTGIVPRFRSDDEAFRLAITDLFDDWSSYCTPDGSLDYYGIQTQICRARRTGAECFIRLRRRPNNGKFPIPIQVQVVESEFVPATMYESLSNGNRISAGIEFDKTGQRVAYWMYIEHPSEHSYSIDHGKMVRIPAGDVIHHFIPTRPGQIRGEPDAVASLLKAHTFDSYDDAELVRKQTKAPYTGFLTRDSWTEDDYKFDPFTGVPISNGSIPELDVLPGTILSGLPGEKLDLFNGDDTGAGYSDFMREQKLSIAAGIGIPFELMTGDWTNINDRIYRAMINEYRRELEALQDQITIHQCCRPIVDWVIVSAVLNSLVPAPGYFSDRANYHKVEHRPQAWKHIHPEVDVNAAIKAIDANLEARDRVVTERTGWDAEDVDKQNVESEIRLNKLREDAKLQPNANKST